jgi:hypothetical protein
MKSALTRFVRTFASSEVAVVSVGVAALNGTRSAGDAKAFVLGTIASLVAASSAYVLAVAGLVASSPLGKSVAQALQVFGSGLATVAVADLTNAAAVSAARSVGWLAAAAVGSGLLSFLTLAKGTEA